MGLQRSPEIRAALRRHLGDVALGKLRAEQAVVLLEEPKPAEEFRATSACCPVQPPIMPCQEPDDNVYAAQTKHTSGLRSDSSALVLFSSQTSHGTAQYGATMVRRTRMRARARNSALSYTERAFGKDCSIATAKRIAGVCCGQVPPCGRSPRVPLVVLGVLGVGTPSTPSALGVLGVCRG